MDKLKPAEKGVKKRTRVTYANYLYTKLPAGANILQLEKELSMEELFENRFLGCKNYYICLDIASFLGWKSFSCINCELNKNLRKQNEDSLF